MSFTKWDIGECCCGGGSCVIAITVTGAGGCTVNGPVSGATITVTGPTGGTCTTDSLGQCVIDITAGGPGVYTICAAKTGSNGSCKTVTIGCPGLTPVSLLVYPTSSTAGTATFNVKGCLSGVLPGATVTIGGGSYLTNSSGVAGPIPVGNGTFPWTVSKSRFDTASGSLTITSCSNSTQNVTLTPSSGYVCACCVDPLPSTLFFTGPLGNVTLTWDGTEYTGCGTFTGTLIDHTCFTTATAAVAYLVLFNCSQLQYLTKGTTANPTVYNFSGCPSPTTPCTTGVTSIGLTGTCSISGGEYDCSLPFSATGTVSGGTGLTAIFNGGFAITE